MRLSKAIMLVSGVAIGASCLSATAVVAQAQDRDRVQDRLQEQVPDQDRSRDQARDRDQAPDQDRSRDRLNATPTLGDAAGTGAGGVPYGPNNVFGWQLMTQQERTNYQNQMRNAATQQEREKIESQHRQEMQQRARDRNITLPGMTGSGDTGMRMRSGVGGGGGGGRGGR